MTEVSLEQIDFRGWAKALRMRGGEFELVATLEVGPRILSFRRGGGINPFAVYEEQAGGKGEPTWKNRGGHRLWLAPEGKDFSYFPDNRPVRWERLGETGVRLTPPPEESTGFQKQIDLHLRPGAGATVVHRLTRVAATPCTAAPWALSVMAPGGTAVVPQPPPGEHPRDLLPNRRIVVWPYTDLSDARYRLGRRLITLRQEPGGSPTKIGMACRTGWAGYLLSGTLFLKRFSWEEGAEYPDDGCNLEAFTNHRMLELETLGPLTRFESGASAEWTENWELHDGLPELRAEEGVGFEERFFSCAGSIFSK